METPQKPEAWSRPSVTVIDLQGHLGSTWEEPFTGLEVTRDEAGNTRISGVIDQARLHGLFKVFRDGGVTILSLNLLHRSQEE